MSNSMNGSAPDNAVVALLLIDVINDLEFPGADEMLQHALPMANAIAALKERARRRELPCIYVNDHFGRWRADFHQIMGHASRDGARGRSIAELLRPDEVDYFVLKPRHSGFFGTALELLLEHLGVRHLILTGLAGNICVSATATDAYMRGYRLLVPADCIASCGLEQNQHALAYMTEALKADTRPSNELDLARLVAEARAAPDHSS